jgi:hypothetical protein
MPATGTVSRYTWGSELNQPIDSYPPVGKPSPKWDCMNRPISCEISTGEVSRVRPPPTMIDQVKRGLCSSVIPGVRRASAVVRTGTSAAHNETFRAPRARR